MNREQLLDLTERVKLVAGIELPVIGECSDALLETELKIKKRLQRSAVIHADETGLRVEGQLHSVHVASNSRLTHYAAAAPLAIPKLSRPLRGG